ncbi:hypothetical protein [Bordetella phage vB_BbrM_PHB04]|uniref:Uncharacterized protein n=1 Tax=Bordetella phage vB_BbrM_PHB04 TaxID=2029657 RepID=A0A291L9X1_9CAUD|nr:hypothetical protein HOS14_gp047 [Bordetella phage vB_BbrM_PHB04]ATI15665.1 hypothetical protein [Bordetella phage vB_BbrM_PHB04]
MPAGRRGRTTVDPENEARVLGWLAGMWTAMMMALLAQ